MDVLWIGWVGVLWIEWVGMDGQAAWADLGCVGGCSMQSKRKCHHVLECGVVILVLSVHGGAAKRWVWDSAATGNPGAGRDLQSTESL